MDVPSLTDFVQLPDCEDQSHSGHLGTRLNPRGSQAGPLSHTLSASTLGARMQWYKAGAQIQQPVVTSRTRSSNSYLSAYLRGLIQPAFGKEWCNFLPPSLSVQGQPLSYECTP